MTDWIEKHHAEQQTKKKGGPGSGHWGHVGRPGKRGGSLPGKGRNDISSIIRARAGMHEVGKPDEAFVKAIQGWADKTDADVFGKGKAIETIEVVTEDDTWRELFPDHPNALGILGGTMLFIDGTWRGTALDQTEWIFHHEVGHAILERSEAFGDWYRAFHGTDRFRGYTAFRRTGDPIDDAREAFSDAYALTRVREPSKVRPHPGEAELFEAVEQVVKGYH